MGAMRSGDSGGGCGLSEAVLTLEGVHVRFALPRRAFAPRREIAAVAGVDLELRRGEALGLVGESGSGKTTLMRLLLGLVRPSAGRVLFAGRPLALADRRTIARIVQPVFQDPRGSLNPRQRVRDIVAMPLEVHRIGDSVSRRARVYELLERVGLPSRLADALPGELSGGQRQRVAIARALAIAPAVLVCDEPTSALDVSVQAQILNLLADLRRDLGLTLLLVSHDLAVVEHLTDRVAVMYLGRIVESAPTDALFDAPAHPYTRSLLASVLVPMPGGGLPDPEIGAAAADPADQQRGCRFASRCPIQMERCTREDPRLTGGGSHQVACWAA
jgi:peptide/nickel transport system ATP-binding protein